MKEGGKVDVEFRNLLGIEDEKDKNLETLREKSSINIEKISRVEQKILRLKT